MTAQAPKGGIEIKGTYYEGGQFLPTDEPQKGKYNRKSAKVAKPRKVETAPYVWEVAPHNQLSIYALIGGIFAKLENGKLVFCAKEQTLAYYKADEENIKLLIEAWNNGHRWF